MSAIRNHDAIRWDLDRAFEEAGLGTPFVRANGTPTRISFGDLDLVTERHGHFLFMEGKRDGDEPSLGQAILYDALLHDGHTVLIFYGVPPTDVRELRWWPNKDRQSATLRDLHAEIGAWFLVVDDLSPRPRMRP